MTEKKSSGRMMTFSVPLGLFDYINPIFYTITSLTIIRNMKGAMGSPWYTVYFAGVLLSLIFGYTIPTGKFIVGLGLIEFVMPVILVFLVNTGILLSGMVLIKTVFGIGTVPFVVALAVIATLLLMIYLKTKKFNTAAVLTGAVGYMLIYVSLITLSIRSGVILPIVLYAVAICLYLFLIMVGIRANLKDPKVHWVIEISNVICQGCVALATVLLFR